MPKNSERSTQWTLRVFDTWRKQTNKNTREKSVQTISLLNKWLPAFVVEARREDGKRYLAATINQLLTGLWRAARIICLGPPTRGYG